LADSRLGHGPVPGGRTHARSLYFPATLTRDVDVVRLTIAVLAAGVAFQAHPLIGTWQLTDKKIKTNGPREVIIREDSSASWGKETSRWRLIPKDKIMIAVGGEWETYNIKIKGSKMTLSGGDLVDPVTLTKVGPATPRPSGVAVPPDPDTEPPAR